MVFGFPCSAPFGAGVNWAPKGAASTSKPATGEKLIVIGCC